MDHFQQIRLLEAILFASDKPLGLDVLAERLPDGADASALLEEVQGLYANRGVTLAQVGDGWAFRTADDLAPYMTIEREAPRKLSRAAMETLAIVAYHQPVTRAEIEEVRGVALSRGTIDTLLEAGWIRPKGRRRAPGKPVTWGTTPAFLDHFGLPDLTALPGVEELKAAGLLEMRSGALAMRREDDAPEDEEEDEESVDERTAFLENDEVFEALETDDHIALDE
ncbi:MAG: SMC-Scp complex subunit ScpB [Alphaproteobacteria bacterium]|nr:SMC-Scp complex subunit ScpB [Alphaproteobacteria bacterium]